MGWNKEYWSHSDKYSDKKKTKTKISINSSGQGSSIYFFVELCGSTVNHGNWPFLYCCMYICRMLMNRFSFYGPRSLFEWVCVYVFHSSIQIGIAFALIGTSVYIVHLHLHPSIRSITLFRAANINSLLDFVFHFSILCCSSSYYSQSVWFEQYLMVQFFIALQTIQTRANTRSARY